MSDVLNGQSANTCSQARLQLATSRVDSVRAEIGKIIVGQHEVVDGVLTCLLAGGHVLLEGVPGLGKTTLLRTLARALNLKYSRIQFTPDLMPGDILGSMVMENDDGGSRQLRFQPGPIFANLVLTDEINRATPKTQSALLEAMQELTVTSGTATHRLQEPFLVMATQNPIEMEGTSAACGGWSRCYSRSWTGRRSWKSARFAGSCKCHWVCGTSPSTWLSRRSQAARARTNKPGDGSATAARRAARRR
jgi:hypothetical protein